MICIVMEEPLKDGEIGNIRENLKDFIHLGQLPRLFNRKVRYYKGGLFNGNAYKKLFNLWWQIY